MSKLKVGDIVWVRTGLGTHEEPATVIEVSCHYQFYPFDCDNNDDERNQITKEDQKNISTFKKDDECGNDVNIVEEKKESENQDSNNTDGLLVRYTVSNIEEIVYFKNVRSLIDDGGDEDEEEGNDERAKHNKRRRSSRNKRSNIEKSDTKLDGIAKGTATATSVVDDDSVMDDDNVTLLQMKSTTSIRKRKLATNNQENTKNTTLSTKEQYISNIPSTPIKGKKIKMEVNVGDGLKSSPHFKRNSIASDSGNDNSNKTKKDNTKNNKVVKNEKKVDDSLAGKPDGYGGLIDPDSIYTVEYSPTARATCKRCDQKISKGEIRIGHRPLFRGKPGFRIYKHLKCIIFSEDVQSGNDVDGYEDLSKDDRDAVDKRVQESAIELQEENTELHPDELVQQGFTGPIRDKPKGLDANLLPFQFEGFSWMYCQEVNVPDIRGGILADEMGMGKTLQTIATILDNRPKLQHSPVGAKHPPSCTKEMKEKLVREENLWDQCKKEWDHEMKMNNVPSSILPKKKKSSGGGARAGTLVVCPVVALTQWKSEIEKFCESQELTVYIYHGPDRSKAVTREMMTKYDVVLTTYQVIEHDFRKMVSPNKVKCPNCGNRFKIDKLHVHLKYFCGEGAQRTEAQSRTRRNSERSSNAQGNSNNTSRGGRKNGFEKKKFTKSVEKHGVKVKGDSDYDSESDLSIQRDQQMIKKTRKPRAAASRAKSRVTATVRNERKLKAGVDSSEEEYIGSDDDSDGSSDADVAIVRAKARQAIALQNAKKKKSDTTPTKKSFPKAKKSNTKEILSNKKKGKIGKKKAKGIPETSNDDDDSLLFGDSNDDLSAKKKKSFSQSKKSKTSKVPTLKKKGMVGKKKAKGTPETSSDDDDDSSVFGDSDDDLPDIDMNELIEEAMAGCELSILHSFCWWRIVLDEAHFIKSRSSQTSAAAFALIGIHRWCLSGTPLQNRVGEFYSLVRFLRLDPMAHYFCRSDGCTCKQVHYRMKNGRCMDCNHSSIQHYSHFNRKILNPIQRDGYANDGRKAMFTLKNEVLDRCLLRRTKDTKAEDMNLPPRIVQIKSIRLHPFEEDFYNAVYTQTTSSFNEYVAEGTLLNNYAHIFDLLMRMRQSVCHPYLVVHSKRDYSRNLSSPAVFNGNTDCHLCNEPPTDRVVSTCCQTAFCKACVIDYMETSAGIENGNAMNCPSCRNPFTIDLNHVEDNEMGDSSLFVPDKMKVSKIGLPSLRELPHVASGSILRRIDLTEFATSSKIEALTMELVNMRRTSPGSKAIVFSQFVNMLDLIRWRLHSDPCLKELGLGVRALHGGMDVKSRDSTLKDFREDHNVRVLLMSLKAGGVALNLTIANYIYLMDPWWNPSAEMQAIDRTHRLGQYRPIRAVRFIASNTVEERILQLQEKKRLVFDGTIGRDAGSLKMLTVDDMKSLFG